MSEFDSIQKEKLKEDMALQKDEEIAKQVLLEILPFYPEYHLIKQRALFFGYADAFLMLLMCLKADHKERELLEILKKYPIQYSKIFHHITYYLLDPHHKNTIEDTLLWPGLSDVTLENGSYQLITQAGIVRVRKASDVFQNTKNGAIFHQVLAGNCTKLTYEFLKMNPDYTAVLSNMPNIFYGFHHHAYLQNEDSVLDIAANCLYDSLEDANKVLNGDIVTQLTLDQVEEYYKKIEKENANIGDAKDKLRVLGLSFNAKRN